MPAYLPGRNQLGSLANRGMPGNQQQQCKIFKASLGPKHIFFSYFIITEPTKLKLSETASPGNSNVVNFFQKVSYIFSHGMQPSWIECYV